jgi:hypothetical protein
MMISFASLLLPSPKSVRERAKNAWCHLQEAMPVCCLAQAEDGLLPAKGGNCSIIAFLLGWSVQVYTMT